MTEDVQPNERPLNRKEATIPIIRPIPASRAPCQRGGYAHSATRYHHKPLNGPQNGTYPFTTSHNHQQYANQSKRSYHHPHDGPYTKRRRTNYESSTEPRHESAKASSFLLPKPPNKSRKSTKRKVHPEPIELLVDLPPQCRKGAPDYRRLRGQWESVQAQELSTNTGVPLKLGGYTQDCARFIFDDNPGSHSEERSGRPEPVDRTPAQPAALPNPDIVLNKVNDEIIIVENIDDLDNLEGSLLPTFPIRSDFDSDLRYPSPVEPARSKTPEPLEPLRVFTSGVLSLSFIEAHGGSIAFQTLPASSEQPYASGSSVLGDTSSQVLQMPDSANESVTVLPNNGMVSVTNGTPSNSTSSTEAAYNHEVLTSGSSTSNEPPFQRELVPEDVSIQLPVPQSDKIRRILHSHTTSILAVSMRGSVVLSDVAPVRHRRTLKMSKPGDSVDDACILQAGDEHITVFGHAREEEQLSWCRSRLNIDQNMAVSLRRPWSGVKKGGVSAVASMVQPLQFATGGYDHIVHLWEVKSDLSSASPRPLAIKHTSQVQSLLAICDTSHKLISAGADCNVHFWDLSSERVVNTLRPSNATYHLHITASPFCTLLEVAHRELQFEVRDHRLVPEYPVLRFGYNTDKVHGRFIKGATSSTLFACGSRDGNVRLWDLRNVTSVPVTATAHQGHKIAQVVFNKSHLIVCSEGGQLSTVRYDSG